MFYFWASFNGACVLRGPLIMWFIERLIEWSLLPVSSKEPIRAPFSLWQSSLETKQPVRYQDYKVTDLFPLLWLSILEKHSFLCLFQHQCLCRFQGDFGTWCVSSIRQLVRPAQRMRLLSSSLPLMKSRTETFLHPYELLSLCNETAMQLF